MIFNLSGRTDLVAFYYPWLKERLKAGYVDVRHPFDAHKVLRYQLNQERVDAFVICTKNPFPLLADPAPFLAYPTLIQVTITPYGSDLEPFVPPKKKTIAAVKELSKIFGKKCVDVRYDPIVLNEKYTIAQHIASFEYLVSQLHKDVHVFIISFVDEYKNTQKHGIRSLTFKEMEMIGQGFGKIAKKYGVCVQTCGEAHDLSQYGVKVGKCLDPEHLGIISGRQIDYIKEKSKRDYCECADYRDIGAYNSCLHLCRYCYANYDESQIKKNVSTHRQESSLLLGELKEDDIIIPITFQPRQIRLF